MYVEKEPLDRTAARALVQRFLATKTDEQGMTVARELRKLDAKSTECIYDDLETVAKVAEHDSTVHTTPYLMASFLRSADVFEAAFRHTNNTPVYLGSFLNTLLGEVTATENHDRLREFLLFRYPRTANEASLSLYFQNAPFGKADAFPYTRETFEPEPGSSMKLDLPEEFE